MNNFSFDYSVKNPQPSKKDNKVIIMFHGYGSNKDDLFSFAKFMNPDFLIISIQAPIKLDNHSHCWWPLHYNDNMQLKMDTKLAKQSVKELNKFICEDLAKKYNFSLNQVYLIGFSQGCMMSLNVGLTSNEKFLCIMGFSGKIIDQINLKDRIKNSTDTLLIHGDADQIVPSTHLLEAKDFLIRNNIPVETLLIKNCDHHIPIEASSTALNYILKKINI